MHLSQAVGGFFKIRAARLACEGNVSVTASFVEQVSRSRSVWLTNFEDPGLRSVWTVCAEIWYSMGSIAEHDVCELNFVREYLALPHKVKHRKNAFQPIFRFYCIL